MITKTFTVTVEMKDGDPDDLTDHVKEMLRTAEIRSRRGKVYFRIKEITVRRKMSKNKFRLIMTTILEVEDINIIIADIDRMRFKEPPPDVMKILNKGTELFEETKTAKRDAKTFVRVDTI